jgi:hypothetical protein
MFCPKCATQNVDGASYCRACGANISLVPQALSGQLPVSDQAVWAKRNLRKRRARPPASIEEAIKTITMGIAFIIISILISKYAPAGEIWWFWMLIPAFGCLGKGFAELARLKAAKSDAQNLAQPQINSVRPADLPAPRTGELMNPVSSVTEGTTRHLGVDANRPFEYSDSKKTS